MQIKHLLLMLAFACLQVLPAHSQRLYVNGQAAGTGEGQSWEAAFTSLNDALAAAPEGAEVWVATGIYTPCGPEGGPASTFRIEKNLKLLGGFAGYETEVEARDPEANAVILSGDLNGDDVFGDFATNRSDNVMNVMTIGAGVTRKTLIEGFTIKGGNAYGAALPQHGGGIHCSGSPVIRECLFEDNYARENGGALFLSEAGGKGIALENCHFNHNRANDGGALYSLSSGISISNCMFTGNTAGAGPHQKNGGAVYLKDSYGVVQNTSFSGNSAFDFGGAAFICTNPSAGRVLEFRSCIFQNNEALTDQGGGAFLYISGDANELLFSGCSFLGNRAGTWGGGLSGEDRTDAVNTVLKLEGCLFHQNYNKIYGDGSGLFFRLAGQEVDFQLTQSTFSENFNNYYATAAIWAAGWSGASGQVTASHCTFRNNSAKNSAGLDMGSPPGAGFFHYRVANCSFFYNEAKKRGGGLTVYSESPATYEVEDCLFEGNFAGGQGGALWLAISNPGLEATIRNCIFKYNESPLGGALLAYPLFFPATREASIRIENSLFVENVSANAVIAGKYSGTIRLANSTIAQNHAGAVLSGAASSFELQNTILYNPEHPGPEASLEDSTAVIRFLGGNLSRDIGIQGLLNPTDQVVSAPLPLLDNNYRLVPNSSAIDAGMAYEGMPDYDLAGNNRLQGGCIDAGAYESPYHSGNGCQVAGATEVLAKTIQIYPNPAGSNVEVHLPLPSQRPFEVWLYDNRGRMVLRQKLKDGEQLNVERLLPGFYWVKAAAEGVVFTGKLITAKK